MNILRIARGRFCRKVLVDQHPGGAAQMIVNKNDEPGSITLFSSGEQYDYHVKLSHRDIMRLQRIIAEHPEFYQAWES